LEVFFANYDLVKKRDELVVLLVAEAVVFQRKQLLNEFNVERLLLLLKLPFYVQNQVKDLEKLVVVIENLVLLQVEGFIGQIGKV
jgi:hypothetical protein